MTSDPVLALSKVLAPSSCLFIGPSRDVSKYTGRPLTLMEKWGYGGEIGIVHRGASGSDWGGQWPVYATIEAACRGRSWDAAMVLVPGSAVADVIDEAANGGVGAAVVIASSLDIDKERVLARGLPILGPNTFGTYATFSDTPLTFSTLLLEMDIRPGGTMIVTQSGGLGNVVVDLIAAGGGVAAFVGTGDEWSIDAADCLRYAAHQPAVDNVGLLLEGLPAGIYGPRLAIYQNLVSGVAFFWQASPRWVVRLQPATQGRWHRCRLRPRNFWKTPVPWSSRSRTIWRTG